MRFGVSVMMPELHAAIASARRIGTSRIPAEAARGESSRPAASVLDLGSNSVKLSHYTMDAHNDFKLYYQRSVRLRLFEGLKGGVMQPEYVDRMVETLRLFREAIDFEGIQHVVAVATSAIRDAKNRRDITDRIRQETGLDFKILSDRDEALYSYTGAVRMLHIPSVLFFDIGGGSLEVVTAKNYKVKSAHSFPLGSLRLTQKFAEDSKYEDVDFEAMKKYVGKALPSLKDLEIKDGELYPAGDGGSAGGDNGAGNGAGSDDDGNIRGDKDGRDGAVGIGPPAVAIVGVGGVLRSLTKYVQDAKGYPLSKTHNYQLSVTDLEDIWKKIRDMPPDRIAKIPTINSSRADTLRASVLVIMSFLKSVKCERLTVSAHGLREGALALSIQHPAAFKSQRIDEQHIRETVLSAVSPSSVLVSSKIDALVELLLSANLLHPVDRPVIRYALEQTDRLRSFRDISNILYTIMDDDSHLSHGDQLAAALALMHLRKRRKADVNLLNFGSIARSYDKKRIRRMSAIVLAYQILEKSSADMVPEFGKGGSVTLAVRAPPGGRFPHLMFEEACSQLEDAFGIPFRPDVRVVG